MKTRSHAALLRRRVSRIRGGKRWLATIVEAAGAPPRDERRLAFLLRLLSRIREPAIVFTEYRDTLRGSQQRLGSRRAQLAVLHGGMTPAERSRVQHAFNEGGGSCSRPTPRRKG